MARMIKSAFLPSSAIQAARLEWLEQLRREQEPTPTLLIQGLRASDTDRWEVGIIDAAPKLGDAAQIVLRLPKPPRRGNPQAAADEKPWTDYWFDQEMVWLIQMHVVYGGKIGVSPSKSGKKGNKGKPNGYYCATIRVPGLLTTKGNPAIVNLDRFTSGAGPYQDARLVNPRDYHNRTRGHIKPTAEREVATQVSPENERIGNGEKRKVTREDAIAASIKLWRPGLLFPSADSYEAAIRHAYAVLDRRPLCEPGSGQS